MRKTAYLSRNRVSLPGARYFVTCATKGRVCGLAEKEVGNRLLAILAEFETSGDLSLVCATLMPDHFHWVFSLGFRLTLAQVVAKRKVRTRPILAGVNLEWQVNFYEHRLRDDEDVEAYAFYVFMNPYVAGIHSLERSWPLWRAGQGVQFHFSAKLHQNGAPPREWLDMPAAQGMGLGIGDRD